MQIRRPRLTVALIMAMLLAISACSSGGGESADDGGDESTDTTADDPVTTDETTEDTLGDEGKAFEIDEIAPAVIADLEAYWDQTMPDAYDTEYEPVSGGFHPYSSEEEPPSCGGGPTDYEVWAFNAFYCQPDDLVAWDTEQLLPTLMDDYGPYAIAMVFAHEWGHAIQARSGVFGNYPTIMMELQADCFAGSWTGWVYEGNSDTLNIDDAAFGQALGGLVLIRDQPGTVSTDEAASPHGSAFDRINSFQEGFENGAARCVEYETDMPTPLDLTFQGEEDYELGGNLPLDDTLQLAMDDLNAYWSAILPEFEPIEGLEPYEVGGDEVPECDGDLADEESQTDQVMYCIDDNVVALDADFVSAVHEDVGDMGVAALLAREWATAAQLQTDSLPDDVLDALAVDLCFTGAWAADIYQRVPEEVPEGLITSLSPGDLDEVILVYSSIVNTPDSEGGGGIVAFALVDALREGFFGGADACAG